MRPRAQRQDAVRSPRSPELGCRRRSSCRRTALLIAGLLMAGGHRTAVASSGDNHYLGLDKLPKIAELNLEHPYKEKKRYAKASAGALALCPPANKAYGRVLAAVGRAEAKRQDLDITLAEMEQSYRDEIAARDELVRELGSCRQHIEGLRQRISNLVVRAESDEESLSLERAALDDLDGILRKAKGAVSYDLPVAWMWPEHVPLEVKEELQDLVRRLLDSQTYGDRSRALADLRRTYDRSARDHRSMLAIRAEQLEAQRFFFDSDPDKVLNDLLIQIKISIKQTNRWNRDTRDLLESMPRYD